MVKKIFLILFLVVCTGCSNSVKKVPVANFDYKKMKQVSYVSDKNSQQIDKEYNVANNHFNYVEDIEGNCSVFNKVSESSDEETYLVSESSGNRLMKVVIYTKKNGKCSRVQSLANVAALSIKQVSYNNRVYINVIAGGTDNEKSGLWVLDAKGKKLIRRLKSLSSDFDIDRETGNLYTIEHLDDGSSYIRAYNQNDDKINQYKIRDEDYDKLFFKNGNISLVSQKNIGEKDGDSLFNYIITMFPIKDLFNNLKDKKYEQVKEIEANNSSFNTMKVVNDYMVFYGDSSVVCKSDYSKCNKYGLDTIELFGGQGYIGINGGANDDEGMYLNKLGTNGVEKMLNYAQSYFTLQEGKNIYFKVFNRDDRTKSKIIKYTLK